ncbi:MAG: bifunctional UDP-N-acetylmuramoyl-tripeptide:D-alanyl-D-alanine ligase/alanine racemase [Alloprevotella sp.]|nr:bifunctional UDP-N-acetylmuramoyl-tripeptide:D-alanyl-D-alanine ligase/alanine racemase [Alloprevotella sp.]
MHYTIEDISRMIAARTEGCARMDHCIDWLLTDSRSLAFPETTLFFALRTQTGDGHRYVADLYRRGVRCFVVEDVPAEVRQDMPEACFLVADSPLRALGRLAELHREAFRVPVVGVTGSNGKTVVKEWLYQLLSPAMTVTRSPRSYNSQVGVPLSVCLLTERTQLGVFEAGISQPGEMQRLRDILKPTIGVMTNLGQAHQENFSSMEQKCLEKLSLFRDAEALVYNADDALVAACIARSGFRGHRLGWSRQDKAAFLYVSRTESTDQATRITYACGSAAGEIEIPFTSSASVENALHCLALCLYLGCDAEYLRTWMAQLEPVAMRLEVEQGVRGLTLINDSYNSDVTSLDIALDFVERRREDGFTLVLSDIHQSGLPAAELYAHVAEMIAHRRVCRLVGIGPQLCSVRALFETQPIQTAFFPSTEAFLQSSLLDEWHDDTILLKGARDFHFEAVSDILMRRVHETTLQVNLEALAANLNFYRSFLKPQTKMVCMIKASAYGAGAVEIARTLQDRGVDYLAVAVADEGAELRKAGVTADIIVMNPEMTSFHTLFEYRLQPEVYSFDLLEALIRAAKREGITNFPVHIKLDTGMRRLGFNPEQDMPALIDRLQHQAALIPRSVFSHFAGADSAEFDDYSAEQFRLFDEASRQLQSAFPHKILRHICNSAGIERFPERHLDMVRLGLGLYGVNPITNQIIHNVSSLKTTILQVRDVAATSTVGYSRRGKLTRPSRIAAIPIGYADGLNRHLGNGHCYCLVNGQRAYYIGNICMDVCMIDVTDIPCRAGDTVEIFGDELPVTVLSDVLQTIPYEILTGISPRVRRVYYQ